MAHPLVQQRRRTPALLAVLGSALVLVALGLALAHRSTTGFDTRAFAYLDAHLGASAAEVLLALSHPVVSIALLLGVVVAAAVARLPRLALLALIAPAVGTELTETVLKPLIGRKLGGNLISDDGGDSVHGTFPSGHETFLASTVVVLVLAIGQWAWRRAVRIAATAVLALWTLGGALGLVRNSWHYATDTIGAIAWSVVVVIGLALTLDAVGDLFGRRFGAPAAAPRGEPLAQLTPRS